MQPRLIIKVLALKPNRIVHSRLARCLADRLLRFPPTPCTALTMRRCYRNLSIPVACPNDRIDRRRFLPYQTLSFLLKFAVPQRIER